MRNVLKKAIVVPLRRYLRDSVGRYSQWQRSYAQEGEDLILLRMLGDKRNGIYVDVGAHHPFRFSNTYLLYERGWRGINIDARPGSMALFQRFRPSDINLEMGICEYRGEMEFFLFEEPALNTFDPALSQKRQAEGWPRAGSQTVQCMPLAEVLAKELPRLASATIDLLSIDVEGLDLQVLRSNDWSRFRPRALVVEMLDHDKAVGSASEIGNYLESVGYRLFSKLYNSAIFVPND